MLSHPPSTLPPTSMDNQLLKELHQLREEVESLRAGVRSIGMRGHLSKFNEAGALAGMFSTDWELRYFMLAGPILRYFTSERDIALEPRGVLDIEGCTVTVLDLPPAGPPRGHVTFQVTDPEGVQLVLLRADTPNDAINWLSAFQDQGCHVIGLRQLLGQHSTSPFAAAAPAATAPQPAATATAALRHLHRRDSARWEKASEGDEVPNEDLSEFSEELASASGFSTAKSAPPVLHSTSGHLLLQPGLLQPPAGCYSPVAPQQSSQGAAVEAAGAAAPAAPAVAAPAAVAPAGEAPDTAAAAVVDAAAGASHAGSSSLHATGRSPTRQRSNIPPARRPPRRAMFGHTPLHSTVKDSPLSFRETWSLKHEGLLNLALVVLVCSNLRAFLENLLTYGLRLSLFRVDYTRLMEESTWADAAAVVLLGFLWVFAGTSLGVERLAWRLLQRELKNAAGAFKRVQDAGQAPSASAGQAGPETSPVDVCKASAAGAGSITEGLLWCLNALNTSACLLLPCALVYFGEAHALPGAAVTLYAIVLWMKLVSYAHCNTDLRCQYRQQQLQRLFGDAPEATAAAAVSRMGRTSSRQAAAEGVNGKGATHGDAAATEAAPAAPAAATAAPAPAAGVSHDPQPSISLGQHRRIASGAEPGPFAAAATSTEDESALSQLTWDRPAKRLADIVRDVVYPQNLTWRNVLWYALAPTLTYQCSYPIRNGIRWKRLAQWVAALLLTASLHTFMLDQLLLPNMLSALGPLRVLNPAAFTERLLKLALPNLYCWLVMFFLVFHLWLNVIGELTRFGDRVFYREWWNAATLADYWKLWNMPVHSWMLRTIYFPLVRRRWNRLGAGVVVFFVSAVLHELAVGVPLRMLKGWAFWAMFLQVPLVAVTDVLRRRLKSDTLGNIIFWVSFCVVGQPMCLLMYYHDWLMDQLGSPEGVAALACTNPAPGMEAICRQTTSNSSSTMTAAVLG